MALYSATANVTNGSDTVTVVGLVLAPSIAQPGAQVVLNGVMYFLDEIVNTTTLKITRNYAGATASGVTLEINTISESETEIVTLNQRTADLLEELLDFDPFDNLESLSLLEGNGVILQDATGQHSLVPKADLTSGVDVDARVETLAGRAAYDLRPEGFSILVNDIGDGRAAVYYKNTNTNADWSTPAYISGPVGAAGPYTDITIGPVITVPSGQPASVDVVQVDPETIRLDFSIPKGQDGTGTGDVVGPSSAANNRIAVFDGTTGKLIKDGGVTVSELVPADGSITNEKLANVPTATIKGRVAAGAGVPADLTATQVLTLLKTAGVYAKDNILGTVSQSSGVPTGAVVERGSNGNGEYVRFADGTQICWYSGVFNITTSAVGSIHKTAVLDRTYPVAFVGTPTGFVTAYSGSLWGSVSQIPGTSSVFYYFWSAVPFSGVDLSYSFCLIGRWF